jgi:tRNA A37 threonylcarbamoyladenosine dehydratase
MITPDELYLRQATLRLDPPSHAVVVGLGGTGSWVALFLAMVGVPQLTLIDPDSVESHNLNRLPVPPDALGKPKVIAVGAEIVRLRPTAQVVALPMRFLPAMLEGDPGDALFDCTDNNQTQDELAEWCQQTGTRYLRSGCDAETITVMRERPGWGASDGDGYGPQGMPVWVGPAVLSAVRAVGAEVNQWPEVSGRIAELK